MSRETALYANKDKEEIEKKYKRINKTIETKPSKPVDSRNSEIL